MESLKRTTTGQDMFDGRVGNVPTSSGPNPAQTQK